MKILLLTINEQEEKVIEKIIAAISDFISVETIQTIPIPVSEMSFPVLEIKQTFPGVFFCPCGRLEALFRAAMTAAAIPKKQKTAP